ncbi:MAG: HEXXH motif-containing putative peptide modification protein, partial [Bdellovibrionales bacterium]
MYGLFGFSHNIKNIYKLAALHDEGMEVGGLDDIKAGYIECLRRLHDEFPIDSSEDLIIRDRVRANSFISAFSGSRINDLEQEQMITGLFEESDFSSRCELVERGLKMLHELNPELSDLFHLAVHGILLAGSGSNKAGLKAYGGSSNRCIGLIWLSLSPRLSLQDLLEIFIHELTHTLVFLDELNYGHFNYHYLTQAENWARSSILKRHRPMDKVLHSIIVASEILNARSRFLPN